jgi:exopolysaccharide biosynthesis polyprenyl glycosylphosphotransferase
VTTFEIEDHTDDVAPARVDRVRPGTWRLGLAVLDIAVIIMAMFAAGWTRDVIQGASRWRRHQDLMAGLVSLPVWVPVLAHYGLYRANRVSARLDELGAIVHASATGILAMATMPLLVHIDPSRAWLAFSLALVAVGLIAERELVRRAFWNLHRRGHCLRSVVIVGTNSEAIDVAERFRVQRRIGYLVRGFIDDNLPPGTLVFGTATVLGGVGDLVDILRSHKASGVVIASTALEANVSSGLVRELIYCGMHVELTSALHDVASQRLLLRPVGDQPILSVEAAQSGGWRGIAKRTFDLTVSCAGLVLFAPVMVAIAVAIKLDSRGPAFFMQQRVGREGKPFRMVKFRTMAADAERRLEELRLDNEADGPLFKIKDDPRVTRVGRVLRSLSLDELPQLWNVIRGQMSLVGPRPALEIEMASWSRATQHRLRARPGLTGMWQVSGRSDCSFDDYIRLDLNYVDNWTLWTDVAILAKTLPVVLRRSGAY